MKKVPIATLDLLFSFVIYGAIMFATLHPDTQRFFTKAFPNGVMSLNPSAFFAVLTAILTLPLFVLLPHWLRLMRAENKSDPQSRRSKRIIGLLTVYFLGLMAAWIIYAEWAGI